MKMPETIGVVHFVGIGGSGMAGEPATAQLEIRASWSPTGDLGPHVEAWAELDPIMRCERHLRATGRWDGTNTSPLRGSYDKRWILLSQGA